MLSKYLIPLSLPLLSSVSAAAIDQSAYASNAILHRDVVVIGGGSSGTYAAVNLKRAGHSVVLVEKESKLGGHVDTFQDPTTGGTFDYGVVALINTTIVRDYFAFLNESLMDIGGGVPGAPLYANLNTDAQSIPLPPSIPWSDPAAVFASLLGYGAQVSNYPFLTGGYDLPDPVPADLLLPFGEFLEKYNLQAFANTAFRFDQGMGNILAVTTLYAFKYLPKTTIDAFVGLAPPPVASATLNLQGFYDKALTYLGAGTNAFVSSRVIAINRSGPRVLVAVLTPSGPKLISAKKILFAIQPQKSSLQEMNLDLNLEESSIFGQFNNSYYWDIVIKNSGIPSNVSVTNLDVNAPLGIPALPGLYGFAPAPLPGYTNAYYSSPGFKTDASVKAEVLATVNKFVQANGFPPGSPQIVGFNSHAPFWLTVPPAKIAEGFYAQLNGLQGKRNTWWTGATFVAHDSSAIWRWSEETLLPSLKASL
ncbi:flavin-containing superfamily amine oxidase [Podospora aff. communis PSN243]|uniref:Flavin-containing superfamily amine oxidase n=1 Tax=Podospora aff. communis PSN243 TaxID=3040156 RepID=A0AAV9GL07_9PEZI|nr:flavin-containing superfamily amine oxidase [Podospora aff. communis PSN243]